MGSIEEFCAPKMGPVATSAFAKGAQRYELLAMEAGNDDPFEMKPEKRAKGTFDEPTIVKTIGTTRTVGCICEEDALSINWMTLHVGEPKRCECGFWFKLQHVDPDPSLAH